MPRALDGDIRARAHGDADIGRGERRRVVDAVPGHGDHFALRPEPRHHGGFPVRQHIGLDLVDAEAACHGLRGGAVVAGQHDNADAVRLQGLQRRRCRRLDGIGDGEDAERLPVRADVDRRRAILTQGIRLMGKSGGIDVVLREKGGIAENQAPAFDRAENALAGGRIEIRHGGHREAPRLRRRHDGVCQRMLRGGLDGGGEPQRLVLRHARRDESS